MKSHFTRGGRAQLAEKTDWLERLSLMPPMKASDVVSFIQRLSDVEVVEPAEEFLDSLVRLGWLSMTELRGLSITPLGRALLRAQSHVDSAEDVLMLPGDSEVSYARLIGHLAEMSPPEGLFVVDPYLRLEALMDMVNQAGAKRFLIGTGLKDGPVATMLIWLEGMKSDVELRIDESRSLHDRYMIGDERVYTLGTSMNSVGKRSTTMLMPLPGEPADHVREEMEKVWESATVRYPLDSDSSPAPDDDD